MTPCPSKKLPKFSPDSNLITVWSISPVAFVIILPFFKKFFDFEFVKYKLGNTTDS